MINDRNTRPRWSNVNRHPHSAGGTGNPYMATLWQWRMLRLSRACLASTSHLSYLSELSFQSIRQADIWMVFNILVGTVCKGGEGSMNMCVCVSVCVWERGGGWDGESENETVWERGVGPLWAFYVFVCVWCWGMGGCLMKSWVNADTAHAHTHTHTHTHKNSHTQTHTHTHTALWHCGKGLQVLITATFQAQHRIRERGRDQPNTPEVLQSISMPEPSNTTNKFNNKPSLLWNICAYFFI